MSEDAHLSGWTFAFFGFLTKLLNTDSVYTLSSE